MAGGLNVNAGGSVNVSGGTLMVPPIGVRSGGTLNVNAATTLSLPKLNVGHGTAGDPTSSVTFSGAGTSVTVAGEVGIGGSTAGGAGAAGSLSVGSSAVLTTTGAVKA